ncbi:MAG: indolepyruvate oxidoreductase subunit beta [Thermodesulfovibrionales bacterium]|nr:indolepyruvate oxidoreductase subunit beta [Thermodesulfovibrionales bacterium]
MADDVVNVLFAGVGGQGVVLASAIMAEAAFRSGYDVKDSELHGMAQRGGSVISHIRFGKKVNSPLIPLGKADFFIATEQLEGLRYAHFVKPKGKVILNKRKTEPVTVSQKCPYPENVKKDLESLGLDVIEVDAPEIAKKIGSSKVENIILLGVISSFVNLPVEKWQESIKELVPQKTIELNLKAFEEGRKFISAAKTDKET